MPVDSLYTSVPFLFPRWKADYCLAGFSWTWDGVQFSFLNPSVDRLNLGNDSSCVLRVATQHGVILLPGDIEREGELFLLKNANPALAADVMVAPHHGSKTSGLREFIGRVHPQYVFYAVGYQNRYHFPHEVVIDNYRAWGATAYDTVRSGAINLNMGKLLFSPDSFRREHKHYWSQQPES
jgi:competence protein ComEC